MKTRAFIQGLRKTLNTAFLTFLILTLSSIISCDVSYDLDWNWDPCKTAPTIKGPYQVADACSIQWGSTDYIITINGTCPNYTISNLFDSPDEPPISVTYTYYMPSPLSIYEQTIGGWTINGSGTIEDGLLTLNLNLFNGNTNMTCTVTGNKK